MPPNKEVEKAERERESAKYTLVFLEKKLIENATKALTEVKIDKFLETLALNDTKVEETFQRIVANSDTADLPPHVVIYETLMDLASELKCAFTSLKQAFAPAPIPLTVPTSSTIKSTDLRLPKLNLPTFSGDLNEWMSFHDLFKSAIHDNPTLSKSQKLTYLKAQVRGEAARQVQSLQVSDVNYDIAWKQLAARYQNDREIFVTIMKRLHDQPNVQPNSAISIRQLLDVSRECIRSLEILKLPTPLCDSHLWFIISRKMDPTSKELWEQSLKDSSIPSLQVLYEFLEQRARALAASGSRPTQRSSIQNTPVHTPYRHVAHHVQSENQSQFRNQSGIKCKICPNQSHPLFKCSSFLGWSVQERSEFIKKAGACFNCLAEGHQVSQCSSQKNCRQCNYKHNTLLHRGILKDSNSTSAKGSEQKPLTFMTHIIPENQVSKIGEITHHTVKPHFDTLLATVITHVVDSSNQARSVRVLADNGSNTNYITEACVRKLGLSRKKCSTPSIGLGEEELVTAKSFTWVSVSPYFDNSKSYLYKALILPKITGDLPLTPFDISHWPHLQNLKYADPNWHTPSSIDMLLGAEFSFEIAEDGKKIGPLGSPVALNSSFGWLIGGGSKELPHNYHVPRSLHTQSNTESVSNQDISLDQAIRKFWEIEEVPFSSCLQTNEEKECEEHFASTCSQSDNGQFVVHLPFKSPRPHLGLSLIIAERRFKQLERRLSLSPQAKLEYLKFMKDYEDMGHMIQVPTPQQDSNEMCYIPHHFVLKEDSTTTKFRVVFDASAKTSNGVSLNDTILVGPTIQDNLINLILRFRLHKVAFTADVAKMYRQILVAPEDADMQRILWREDPTLPMKHYKLLTVTYGTGPGSFLATKALQSLVSDKNKKLTPTLKAKPHFAQAAATICRDFYVDDLISGEATEEEALQTQSMLLKLMSTGGFMLRKWSSNCKSLLDSLPPELRETQSVLEFQNDPSVKTLGICWSPAADIFTFNIKCPPPSTKPLTKRRFLSELATIFDPIGWLAPVLITAKILMQSVHKLENGWDEDLPTTIQQLWCTLLGDIVNLRKLKIPRYYLDGSKINSSPRLVVPVPKDLPKDQNQSSTSSKAAQATPYDKQYTSSHSPVYPTIYTPVYCLVGYSDASIKAYAGAVYFCTYQSNHAPSIQLVTAKTRVSPLKTVSLPRLELCGALLVAELLSSVQSALHMPFHSVTAWSDSTITLGWIQSHPHKWTTFVANRITKIQNLVPPQSWGFVKGEENPADCASRGISANELINHPLWWNGAPWLKDGLPNPQAKVIPTSHSMPEERKVAVCHTVMSTVDESMLNKFSSLTKLLRVTAFVQMFVRKLKEARSTKPSRKPSKPEVNSLPILSPEDLNQAMFHWVRITQIQSFGKELRSLKKGNNVPNDSKIKSLSPFVDPVSILRVGGRLRHSELCADQKNPMLLPRSSKLTDLIIHHEHYNSFHGGPQLLLSTIQRRFWIIHAKDAIRKSINQCVTCARHNPRLLQPSMADLPSFRVTPSRPFLKCGVDYAGPFQVKPMLVRSKTTIKAYIALFVCCSTRAVHLELVSSLSTDAFLAAFWRFVSRRGRPSDVYSDCGTNFVGANRELKEMLQLVMSAKHNQEISNQISKDGISWHFNPPGAPHFGGLWEAGVKSVKYHLKRIMGPQRLNFEELTTAIIRIEAILNSRPLTPESSDPNDLKALTPGHFLVGSALTTLPEASLEDVKTNRLSRWQFIQSMTQDFWRRWSGEYLTRLQQRPKWIYGIEKISVGSLVTIKEENLAPLHWRLARVIQLYPGPDGVNRVATLKTSNGELKRPLVKLALLPINCDSNEPPQQEPEPPQHEQTKKATDPAQPS